MKATNKEVLKYMTDYFVENGHYPTHVVSAEVFGVSRQRITQVVKNLIVKGKLKLSKVDEGIFMNYDYRHPVIDNAEAVLEAVRKDKNERR